MKKAVYIAIGINLDGRKSVLGMWVGENESAKFWATVLNGLRNRGVEDIFIACTDNLTGFSAAIEAVFPQTEVQNCIIHQLRNSSRYVSYKDLKALMADLKAVYGAVDEQAALDALDVFSEHWDKKYPKISQSWRDNWANLSTYFKYPQEVRRLIYTTNAIEGFNRQLRKVTKSKSVFPTDDSLLKMLYLAMMDITKKWTGRRQDWSKIYAQLTIFFAERMPVVLQSRTLIWLTASMYARFAISRSCALTAGFLTVASAFSRWLSVERYRERQRSNEAAKRSDAPSTTLFS